MFGCFVCLLRHCSVLYFSSLLFCLLRHYTISSRFPLIHCLPCYVNVLFSASAIPLLFATSLYYLFNVSNVSLCVCCVIARLTASIVPSSVCDIIILSSVYSRFPLFHYMLGHCCVLGFHCSIFRLLRQYTIYSRFPLFYYLFVTSQLCPRLRLIHLLFVMSLHYFKGFHCFIICLLRHCSVLGLNCFLF